MSTAARVPRGGAARRFARNAAALVLSRLWSMAAYLVWLGVVNRGLGAVEMGKMYGILSFITLVTIIPSMGMDQGLVRLTSRKPENASLYLGVALVVRNLLSIVALLIVGATAFFAHWERDVLLATGVGCIWILAELSLSTNYAVYLAHEQSHYETLLTMLQNTLNIPFTFVALRQGYGLVGVFGAMAAANVVTVIVGWAITTGKFVKPRLQWDKALVKEMLHLCFTIGFSRSTRVLYWRIDTMFLLALVPGSPQMKYYAISIYNTASNLIRKAATFQSTVARPLLPIASRSIDDRERLQLLHKKAFKMLLLVSVPMCGIATACAPVLIRWLSGKHFQTHGGDLGFAPAVPLLAFYGVMLLTTYALSSVRVIIVALEMQAYLLKQSIIMLVLNAALDAALIPLFARWHMAWWGPAVASLVAELYISVVLLVAVSRKVGAYPDLGDTLRILFCGVVMVAAGWYAGRFWPPLPFLVAPIVYLVAVVLTRAVRREEIALLRGRRGGEGRGRRRRMRAEEAENEAMREQMLVEDVERTT